MSNLRRDSHLLADIQEAAQRIFSYIEGLEYEDFLQHPMVQDAVLHNLQIIGKATKKLSNTLRITHPEVPWRDMAGMRDKIVHDYVEIDYEVVWDVVQQDLPLVLLQIERILEDEEATG